MIIGILFSNSLFFLFGCLAKVGYFPFSLLLSYQYYLCFDWSIQCYTINYALFIFLILATITLTFSLNNVILLFNFLSIIFIFSFSLLVFSYILITLLILIIYSSLSSILFLVNGLLVMNSLSFRNELRDFGLLMNYYTRIVKVI